MIKVLFFTAIAIGLVVSEEDTNTKVNDDVPDDLEPQELYAANQYINLKDNYDLGNYGQGIYDKTEQRHNILPLAPHNIHSGGLLRHDSYNHNSIGHTVAPLRNEHIGYHDNANRHEANYLNIAQNYESELLKRPILNYNNYKNQPYQYNQDIKTPLVKEVVIPKNNYNVKQYSNYEQTNYGYPQQSDRHLNTEILEKLLLLQRNNYDAHSGRNNNAYGKYDGYPTLGVLQKPPVLPVKEPLFRGNPYLQYKSDNVNNQNYNGYGRANLGYTENYNDYQKSNNYGLSHGYPQAYRHFKDVAVAVKDLLYPKNNNYHNNAYTNLHNSYPRLRHNGYQLDGYKENIGTFSVNKIRPQPYVLPEYRRYGYGNNYEAERNYYYDNKQTGCCN